MTSAVQESVGALKPEQAQLSHLKELTGFRFIAAMLVVFSHFETPTFASENAARIFFRGYSGVTAFFILSGVVLTWSQLSKGTDRVISYRNFMVDRVSKIYPLHLFTTFVIIAFLSFEGVSRFGALLNVSLLHAWSPDLETAFSLNTVSWSLSVELFLYLCFPFAFLIAMKTYRKYQAAGIAIIASVGLAIPLTALGLVAAFDRIGYTLKQSYSAHYFLYRLPLSRLGDFVIGIAIALLIYHVRNVRKSVLVFTQAIAVASYIWLATLDYEYNSFLGALSWDLLWVPSFSCAIASLGIQAKSNSSHFLRKDIFVSLGLWSFAIYLVHFELRDWFKDQDWQFYNSNNMYPLLLIFALGVTILISALMHRYLEMPLQKLIRRKFRKKI